MKYKLRNIIAIIFIGVCIYLVTLNNQKDDIKTETNIIESNAKFMRSLDPDANELSRMRNAIKEEMNEASGVNELNRIRDAIKEEMNEASGVNELNRIRDAIKEEMNEASGVNELNRIRDATSKEIEESLYIID